MQKIANMPYVIGIKVRIYPDNEQKDIIAVNEGASRFIYNRLVARDREMHALKKVGCYIEPVADRLDYLSSLGTDSSSMKAAYPFLEDKRIDAQTIANAIKNYHTAWKNFREKPGTSIPTFHKKGYSKRYQTNAHYPSGASLVSDGNVYLTDQHHIQFPKLGSVRFKESDWIHKVFARTCETRIGTIAISMDECGCYFASLQVGSVCPFHKKMRASGNTLGIDMNVENFCTDSNGTVTDNPKYRKRTQDKLAKKQRKLSRMACRAKKEHRPLRDSRNYQKQRLKVAKLHKHAAAQREAFQHILSKAIIESQDVVFVEDLRVKNMVKNHCLAGAISDCSWSSFFQKLEYKAGFYGRAFLKVRASGTTQTCSTCGHVLEGDSKLTLKDREWTCPVCGTHHDRDYNSAVNIKNRGMEKLLVS